MSQLYDNYCPDDAHIFYYDGNFQPSGFCQCGQTWYNAATGDITSAMIFQGYNPYGPRSQPTQPANAIPLANFKAAQLIPDATHISADGEHVYVNDGERVYYWDDESKRYGSSFPCNALPSDVVKL